MKIDDAKPGMVVYDVHSHQCGNTVLRTLGCWHIEILEIDKGGNKITASWNGNTPQVFYEHSWKKWRVKKPVLVKYGFGQYRLQTREEKKASKANAT